MVNLIQANNENVLEDVFSITEKIIKNLSMDHRVGINNASKYLIQFVSK